MTPMEIYRVNNKRDHVPYIPAKFLGFQHSPREVWLSCPDGDVVICSDDGEDPACHEPFDWIPNWYECVLCCHDNRHDHKHYFGIAIKDQKSCY